MKTQDKFVSSIINNVGFYDKSCIFCQLLHNTYCIDIKQSTCLNICKLFGVLGYCKAFK